MLTPTFPAQNAVGQPIKGSSATVYRLMENEEIRHISDWATYLALGYEPGDIITVPDAALTEFPLSAPITRWVMGENDQSLYLLQTGERFLVPDTATFLAAGGSPLDVSIFLDELLATFPIAEDDFPAFFESGEKPAAVTASIALGDDIWWATDDGKIHVILSDIAETELYTLSDLSTVTAMLVDEAGGLFLGTNQGDIWRTASDRDPELLLERDGGWISALVSDGNGGLWIADRSFYDVDQSGYFSGADEILKDAQFYHK